MSRADEMQQVVSPESWPKGAIVILNWNGWRDTIGCLESVEKLMYPNYEVILVDNGSADDSVAQICNWIRACPEHWGEVRKPVSAVQPSLEPGVTIVLRTEKLTLIRSEENLGFAGGCNLAIDYALKTDRSTEFIFLLNNDARIEPGCLTACVAAARQANAGIAGALIKSAGDDVTFAGARFPLELFLSAHVHRYPSGEAWWPAPRTMGAAMLIRRDLIEARRNHVGYVFDPDLFAYCEELELCVWATRHSYRVIVVRDAVVRHQGAGSTGGAGNPIAYYYLTRNRVRLARRLLPFPLRIVFHFWYPTTRLLRAIWLVFRNQLPAARAIVEGLRDGYTGVGGRWANHRFYG